VAYLERGTRVGRSQGASIFWGLVSVCFAAAACFYYWKNHESETAASQWRDTALQYREDNETLNSQKDHLQASLGEEADSLKTREDLVQEKETELAAEETRLDGLGRQSQIPSEQNQSQAAAIKKFNDFIRKFGKDGNPDVVERGGRPVLRVPSSQLFAPGDATLKPDGKALLKQLAQAINGQIDSCELRVVSYTDSDGESGAAGGQKKDSSAAKTQYATSWDLTAARASAIARYFVVQTELPTANVLVMGRGDSEPIVTGAKDDHTRNCRVEITVTPLPPPFHAPDLDKTAGGAAPNPLTPPPDPAAAPKDKSAEP
jgi:chemotaxis protein MotB